MFRFKSLFLVGILLAAALMDKTYAYAGCINNSDCSSSYDRYCCAKASTIYGYRTGVCGSSCVGQDCDDSTDCGSPDECCQSGTCKACDISTGLATWIVAVIVISVLLVVAVPVGIVVCCCCCVASASSRPVCRGVVVTQQNPATSVIAVQNSQMQNSGPAYIQNPPYGNQLQAYPPPGPPQQQKQGYPPPPAYNAHY